MRPRLPKTISFFSLAIMTTANRSNAANIEQQVRQLIGLTGRDDDFGLRPPPLVDVYSSRAGTPFSTPTESARRLLTPKQEQSLIARLHEPRKRAAAPPDSVAPGFTMNAHSAKLAQGLEPIEVRTAKLIRARERRMEKLVEEKLNVEKKEVTGQPLINPTSRRIAERLTPEERSRIVEARRKILIQEARERQEEDCWFRPKLINHCSMAARENVTDRLSRDAETRRAKQAQAEREKFQRETALVKPPEITSMAKSFFLKNDVSVHERLSSRPRSRSVASAVVSYKDFTSQIFSFTRHR